MQPEILRSLPRRLCWLLLLVAGTAMAADESYIQLQIDRREQLDELSTLVAIDAVRGRKVWAYAIPAQLQRLQAAGYSWQQLQHPGDNDQATMGLLQRLGEWDAYPTYDEYITMMQGYAERYPELCQVYELGSSTSLIRPHKLLAVKISDNPQLEEDEPEVLLTSTMHGDETVGYVLLLRLIDELLGHYSHSAVSSYEHQITWLIDSSEIWINPLANPDGAYYGGDSTVSRARRGYVYSDGNLAAVDPNRNYPDPAAGDHPDGNPWWQETEVMMAFAEQHRFVISANLHGGAELVNYPWDTWLRRHTDDLWFIKVAHDYVDQVHAIATAAPYYDSGYMRDQSNGITNGYDWYRATGTRQDFMTYWHGGRETTIELSLIKNPPADELPDYWEYNRRSLLAYLEQALCGVRGLVTDGDGDPLDARVEVAWYDVAEDAPWVRTDPEVGDYHRMLLPGYYWLVVRADGYVSDCKRIYVGAGEATRFDVVLDQDQGLETDLDGRVLDAASGLPIDSATVVLADQQVVSGDDGSFWISGLAEGAWMLEIAAPGYQRLQTVSQLRYPVANLDLELRPELSPRRPSRRATTSSPATRVLIP
jgi:hypothetical protein